MPPVGTGDALESVVDDVDDFLCAGDVVEGFTVAGVLTTPDTVGVGQCT